jgi:DNA-binding LytR/AlgR family response regulator
MELSLFSLFRIALMASFPSIVLKLADVNKTLRDQLKFFVEKNIKLGKHSHDEEEPDRDPVVFTSESRSDKIAIHPEDILLVKSADNYIKIVYKDKDEVKQKMLRKTITNIGVQLRNYPEFLRCHRTCIINTFFITSLTNNYKGYRLQLLDYDEEIPVSRQYILAVKEYLNRD